MDTVRKFFVYLVEHNMDNWQIRNSNSRIELTFKNNHWYYYISDRFDQYCNVIRGTPETKLDVGNVPEILINELLPMVTTYGDGYFPFGTADWTSVSVDWSKSSPRSHLIPYIFWRLSPYINGLESNVARLENNVARLETAVDRLVDTLSERIESGVEKTEIISTMYDNTETLQREMAEMRDKIQRDAEERETLQREMAEMRDKIQRDADERETLQREIAEMRDRIQRDADERETLQREMAEMRAQMQRDASLVSWDNL